MPARRTRISRRLRTTMSGTEALIWTRLRGGKLDGWRFRRQKPIGPYFVDFYCPAAWLVIEVDGPVHDRETRWAYDARRKAWLEAEGYRVLTIPVSDIGHDLSQVMDRIRANLPSGPPGRLRRPPPHKNGEDLSQGQPTGPSGGCAATSPLRGEELLDDATSGLA
ncbi:MAG: DUF559 domain-containing protein [Chloroflexi bacterium]|nr:MAG: DUF559 domain-containing protein [Chloroflexota bacterium]